MDFDKLKEQWLDALKEQSWDHCDPSNTYRPEPALVNDDIHDLPTLILQKPRDDNSKETGSSGRESSETTIPVAGPDSNIDIVSGPAQYQFLDVLGRGGMGVVYKAIQLNLAREVAIKKIRPERVTPGLLAAFHIEARLTARLDHPNIVPIYDLGQDQDSAALLVMKVVRGESWKRLLKPLSPEQEALAANYDLEKHLNVLVSVCHGLAFAHSRGVLHCDLKPENIMVGAFGEILIMDWGVAVDIRELSDFPDNHLPSNHKLKIRVARGTPVYMPPELALGKGKDLNQSTDIYLLGALLFEILEGSAPHSHQSLGEVLMKALKSDIRFQSDSPDEIKDICKKA
ncbi:MAG: serine/threonine-protein kinase, partial [Planctomycetota bacterium]|nr:serine/threonine-protein kinase [Planctomycetota bacterium]